MAFAQYLYDFARANLIPLLLSLILYHAVFRSYNHDLDHIPGPFLARYTDLWRLVVVWRRQSDVVLRQLHDRHGPVVRIGPNCVDISDPAAVEQIYGVGKKFAKSNFYEAWKQPASGKPLESLFNTQNEDYHSLIKKPVTRAYAMSTLVEYESYVDSSAARLIEKLETCFANTGEVCDLAAWLQFFAVDVVSELTFSAPLGFLESGVDIDGMTQSQRKLAHYQAIIGQMPWVDYLLRKNPLFLFFRSDSSTLFTRFARNKVQERLASGNNAAPGGRVDFLSHFLDAKDHDPSIVDMSLVVSYTMGNIFAGSDTTATTLRAIMYYLHKKPTVLRKLRDELDSAVSARKLSSGAGWSQVQQLPYLDAVVKESMRLFPGVGLPLERVVPTGTGLDRSDGIRIPQGTIVGMSACIVHDDRTVYGPKTEAFSPERWLQTDDEDLAAYNVRVGRMKTCNLTFGHGSRTCIGKNISLLEIYKIVPTLLLAFEFEVDESRPEWRTFNSWFAYQEGIYMRIRRRLDH